ncbi:MAG TPA: hypothetical protein VMV79_04120, partial [Alphaproteobacteria bacterium]|nr:hypothetical protein [Alphaproteobacteria bacterium]
SFSSGVLLYPAYGTSAATNCDTYGLVRALKGRALGGDRPHIIMNTMDIGPELLFRTDDEVLAAPYHTDVNGNLDAWRFFATTDPAQAEAIARRRHADLVISCFMIPRIYVGDAGSGMPLNFDLNGNPIAPLTHRAGGKAAAPKPRLIQLLAMGRPPSWLQHILIPNAPNFLVYRVKLPKREAARPHRARRAATRK